MIPRKLQELVQKFPDADRRMVMKAYEAAEESLAGRMRSNSHPFIEHPIGVARIVSMEIGLMADAVTAVFLHEANRFQTSSKEQLNSTPLLESFRGEYPKDVIAIVEGLNKIAGIQLQEANLDAECYRKLIISYSSDPRVVLIKIADRLEIMRNINMMSPAKRISKVSETMMLYVPLAHQLGLYAIKSELEDIFLKTTEPKAYAEIGAHLKTASGKLQEISAVFIDPLKEKLDREGIRYIAKARVKSIYSTWNKMQKQNVDIDHVFDIFAMRFIIDTPPDHDREIELCWKVYSLVTEEYIPDTKRLRDWISKPRDNGYESLHTTVAMKDGTPVEVQIRTTRMDDFAEHGGAAHWSYKGVQSHDSLTGWLNSVRAMMESNDADIYEKKPTSLEEILVYTPTGDLRQLRKGASVLDFAFEIHSNLGLRCTGAKINGKMVSIREKLHTGDVVDIISSKNQKPTADWLNWVVSSKARSKIKQKLKEEENARAAIGKDLLARRLKNWKLVITDSELNTLIKKYKFPTINEFFGALGQEQFDVMEIKEFLLKKDEAHGAEENTRTEKAVETVTNSEFVIDRKLKGVELKTAKCCNPVYGDPIFGFITIKDGIKIHRQSCPNAYRLRSNYPYRMIEVAWKPKKENAEKADTHKGGKGK